MAGVDDAGRGAGQVNPHQQASDKLALAGLLGQRIIRQPRLLGQLNPRRRALRRPPTSTVANRAASIVWPIASVIDTCSASRSSEKSKVSPPTSPAGCSQARVNCPASHVKEPGNSRCWISAASDNGTERCPHSKRSVYRRFAMTTYAKKCAARATSATVCATGKSSSPNSRTPTASPRLVTGANNRAPPSSTITSTVWAANARACGVPTNGTCSAVSFPCNRSGPFPPEWPSRISDRPLKSAIKKLTSRRRSPPPARRRARRPPRPAAPLRPPPATNSSSTAIADPRPRRPKLTRLFDGLRATSARPDPICAGYVVSSDPLVATRLPSALAAPRRGFAYLLIFASAAVGAGLVRTCNDDLPPWCSRTSGSRV